MSLTLLVTMGVGLALRWTLAGGPFPPGGFTRWRHVHSHLGYYAVLFPLLWAAWRRSGAATPERRVVVAYAAAVALAIFGFLRVGGYGPEAMAGSTIVLLVWLRDAWRNRARVLATRDWLGSAPVTVPLAALCVPAVAVLQRRDPGLSREVLNAFLALLLLGAVLPGALRSVRAAAPPSAAWTVAALLAAAWLGPFPGGLTAAGVVALGVLVAWSVRSSSLAPDRTLGWVLVAAGLIGLGSGWVPNNPPVAIGAIHFLVLGPLLDGLTSPTWRASRLQRWVSLGAAAAMGGALVAQGLGAGPWTATAAAWAGTVVFVAWCWRLLAPMRGDAPAAPAAPYVPEAMV